MSNESSNCASAIAKIVGILAVTYNVAIIAEIFPNRVKLILFNFCKIKLIIYLLIFAVRKTLERATILCANIYVANIASAGQVWCGVPIFRNTNF